MIVGLDPSLTATGIAYLTSDGTCSLATLRSSTHPEVELRLARLRNSILAAVLLVRPSLVVIEGLSFGSNDPSAQERAWLHFTIRLEMWANDIQFVVVPPSTLKKFTTGSGAAKKEQMMLEVFKRFDVSAADNNQADATALAFLGATYLGQREPDNQAQREVIEKLKNPAVKTPKKRKAKQ
jgi:crossover junction endodeoxyribonuclease RuvC